MNKLEALYEIFGWTRVHNMDKKKSIAHYWHKLPLEVREKVAQMSSDDFKKAALWPFFDLEHKETRRDN